MRIVQAIGWCYPDSLGGTEVYVDALARRLQQAGHHVVVAAPDPGGTVERDYRHEGVEVHRYPTPAEPTKAECQGTTPVRGAERFHQWLVDQRPDVFHCHTFVTGLGLAELEAAKRTGARVVVTTHSAALGWLCQRGTMMRWGESLCDGLLEPRKCAACELQHRGLSKNAASIAAAVSDSAGSVAARLPGRLGTMLGMASQIRENANRQQRMLEVVDRFTVLTQWAADAMIANGAPPEKIVVNRLGVSQQNFVRKTGPEVAPTKSPIRVGYLGRFDRIKGVVDLAHAVAALPEKSPIVVEFRGPIRTESERQVVEEIRNIVGNSGRAEFTSAVSPSEVPKVLASWDLACFPARSLEGGPTAALEAFAVGTPVVGARIGGLAEFVHDGVDGRLYPPGDWRGLAAILQSAAECPGSTIDNWRRRIGPVRTMDDVTADYLKLYQQADAHSLAN